jgi:N-acyl amino acid synthase of PEP-CTERM/exosortase system
MSAAPSDFAPYFSGLRLLPEAGCALMQRVHALRFEVYCTECDFLPAADYPDGRESDRHDAISQHFCALNLQQELVGYVRLVPADEQGRFPFQARCAGLFDGVTLPPPQQAGEISRLIVHKHYRRRRGDTLAGVTIASPDQPPRQERRNDSPQILLTVFRQIYAASVGSGTRYWYAAMERSLARALKQLGFDFKQIGPVTDYYGPVAPYLADLRELEASVGQTKPELLRWMCEPLR